MDWVIDMDEILNNCYVRLQTLKIEPTRENMEILLLTLYDLQKVYKQLKGECNNVGTEDRPADHHE